MSKLYELLAVEPDLRSEAQSKLREVAELFVKGTGRFIGQITSFHKLLEDEHDLEDEEMVLATNVEAQLQDLFRSFGSYLDVTIKKEVTNANTEATVSIGSEEFTMPATALLNLENRLDELKKVYAKIPTLDPTEIWEYDAGQMRYVSQQRSSIRTKKVPRVVVKYDATEEHPAQTEMFAEDVPSYRLEKTVSSGAMTLREKTTRIERIDELIRTVKRARQRANDVDVEFGDISGELFEHING